MDVTSTSVSKEKTKSTSEFYRGIFVILPLIIAGVFLQALVVILLWQWFVMPLGVKALSYWQGLGLMLLVGFIGYRNPQPFEENIKRDADYWYRYLKRGYGVMAFTLVAGWLVHFLSRG